MREGRLLSPRPSCSTVQTNESAIFILHLRCKVGKNAILGLSRAEMVRNTCFHNELVSVTYASAAQEVERNE